MTTHTLILCVTILFIILGAAPPKKPVAPLALAPKILWLYWETPEDSTKPAYIELCHDTILHNCKDDFDIRFLSPKNLTQYFDQESLPSSLHKLRIPQKADYIRLLALSTYGGMWLDSDIIVFRSLSPLMRVLNKHDFAGFGCHSLFCKTHPNGKGRPANWALISRPRGILMTRCLKQATKIINEHDLSLPRNYHKIGRELLWDNIKVLKNQIGYDYYHFDSTCIERDSSGNKYTNERLLSKTEKMDCHSYFMPMYHTAPGFPKWFKNMDSASILNGNFLVSSLFRVALSKKIPILKSPKK